MNFQKNRIDLENFPLRKLQILCFFYQNSPAKSACNECCIQTDSCWMRFDFRCCFPLAVLCWCWRRSRNVVHTMQEHGLIVCFHQHTRTFFLFFFYQKSRPRQQAFEESNEFEFFVVWNITASVSCTGMNGLCIHLSHKRQVAITLYVSAVQVHLHL